jgi:hypothetical protein
MRTVPLRGRRERTVSRPGHPVPTSPNPAGRKLAVLSSALVMTTAVNIVIATGHRLDRATRYAVVATTATATATEEPAPPTGQKPG